MLCSVRWINAWVCLLMEIMNFLPQVINDPLERMLLVDWTCVISQKSLLFEMTIAILSSSRLQKAKARCMRTHLQLHAECWINQLGKFSIRKKCKQRGESCFVSTKIIVRFSYKHIKGCWEFYSYKRFWLNEELNEPYWCRDATFRRPV